MFDNEDIDGIAEFVSTPPEKTVGNDHTMTGAETIASVDRPWTTREQVR